MNDLDFERDFILDPTLALYLPFWKKDGAQFMSDDRYGHLATVTGAIWTPQGRTFDGINDKISVANDASIQLTQFTIIVWFNYSALDGAEDKGLCGKNSYGVGHKGYFLSVNAGGAVSVLAGDNTANFLIDTIGGTSANTWHMGAGTFDGTYLTAYLDGVASGSPDSGGGFLGIVDSGGALTVGEQLNDADRFWDGLIGEVILYNKPISNARMNDIRDATKWRYK